ncbi:putative quinol monooxygenase [Kiloniella laminariae]|uniref:Quinol monooxygenase n=1 Tax=Kiloniella laminariae TaxID=454162 RepID=A0ABT4LKJ1_9PROT|nr:putative quinol monooxygenase [Kiloniella laminariae]MCZ4281475.1 putative quinol monooxygenase [Kiloniella laminariae]
MYTVLVDFTIKPGCEEKFRAAVLIQAQASLHKENNCKVFDVCVDPQDKLRFFLYELYSTAQDFNLHLKSDHFAAFNQLVSDWISDKKVRFLERI